MPLLLDGLPLQPRPARGKDDTSRSSRRGADNLTGTRGADSRSQTILVAGGGIAGLTAALACASVGYRVRVVERAVDLKEAGAGIQISPNAGRVLADLGLDSKIAEMASEPGRIEVRGWRGNRITTMPLGRRFRNSHGAPYRTIHRSDLLDVLVSAAADHPLIDLLPGHELVEFAIHSRGITAMVEQQGVHAELAADILIGADGIGSFVRSVLPGGRPRRPTGRAAWRLVIKASDAPESLPRDRIGLWLGRGGHVVHYPVRGGNAFNVVVVAEHQEAGARTFANVRDQFRRWGEPTAELIAMEGDWRRWPIATVHPSGPWVSGPVALIGDAAHAMEPYLAQGGAMAIEDASVLARMLGNANGPPEPALAAYQAERRRRVTRVWRAAHNASELYHMGGLTAGVRNLAMGLLGGSGLAWRYDWIYRWPAQPNETRRPKAARSKNDGEDLI